MTEATDEQFAENVVNSILDVFVTPELVRRNMTLEKDDIRKVVVEIDPDRKHPRVLINDQVEIAVQVRASKVEDGIAIQEADIQEVVAVVHLTSALIADMSA